MNLSHTGQTVPPFILARSLKNKRADIQRMLNSLQTVGRFLVTPAGDTFYSDNKSQIVVAIEEGDRDFMVLMGGHGFCADKVFLESAQRHALAFGTEVNVCRTAFVNEGTCTAYVHSQGTDVFKISATGIATIKNGDDDVYFVREPGSTPFRLADLPAGCGDLFLKYLLKPFYQSASSMSIDQARFMMLAWCCSIFLPGMLPIMPLMVLVGPPSSGKTCFMRMLSELIFGSQLSVIRTPGDQKSFDAVLGRHSLVCMDNVTEWSWLDGRMESIARHETVPVRRGNHVVEQRLDCVMAMTARRFPDAGLKSITRLLPVLLERPENPVPERILVGDVRRHRDFIMTQLLQHLQKLLADINSGAPGYIGSYATADFADIAYRLARTIGFEQATAEALDRLAAVHDAVLPAEQQVVNLVDIWLNNPANTNRPVRATELQREISAIAKDRGVAFTMNERSFAHWLKACLNTIRQFFDVDAFAGRSRQFFYRFSRREVTGG